ncbi:hypothetical protein VTN00DRAFT_5835 [Thermoascus crustaceus]|uniref:uncharacterized protein n=1 Tax=Thermoascus crustaceus TaxID=5088 RepID=UPI003743D233
MSLPQIPSIDAILAAYRTGRLQVKQGIVSYWVHRKQLSDLKPLDVNDVIKAASESDGDKECFWVEEPLPLCPSIAQVAVV